MTREVVRDGVGDDCESDPPREVALRTRTGGDRD